MPLLLALALALAVVLAAIVLMPLTLVQRYRVGTARRLARGWFAGLNLIGIALSIAIFLVSAALTNVWVPRALAYALAGLLTGSLLGLIGLALTRWDASPRGLHYTPNRLLVLTITLVVSARLLYGVWRAWHTWRAATDDGSWLVAAGVAGSLAAGAVVLGYYFVYWAGVLRRIRQAGR